MLAGGRALAIRHGFSGTLRHARMNHLRKSAPSLRWPSRTRAGGGRANGGRVALMKNRARACAGMPREEYPATSELLKYAQDARVGGGIALGSTGGSLLSLADDGFATIEHANLYLARAANGRICNIAGKYDWRLTRLRWHLRSRGFFSLYVL